LTTPKPEQKKQPFVKTPNPLLFLYTFLPTYKAEMTVLYGLLVHYYNANEGYAWPNEDTLAFYYGKTTRTTREHLKVLKECGLVSMKKVDGKWRYKPLTPLDDDQFFARFPDALAEKEAREKARDEERERVAVSMANLRAKKNGNEDISEPDIEDEVAVTEEVPPEIPVLDVEEDEEMRQLRDWL
jgi:DNA-binding transcriptional ArsR family regulator